LSETVQFREGSVGIRQLAVGIRLKQNQRIRTEIQAEIRLEGLASHSSRAS
jgi:hypothetical protein